MSAAYAVIGSPVKHSKSPRIHSLFAKQTGEDVSYEAVEVSEAELAGFLRDFFRGGGKGLNVTVPHKEAVYRLVDSCTPRAELARAVNTVLVTGKGALRGDNTDGAGLVCDLMGNHGVTLRDSAILILGAGGATRGVLPALLEQQPGSITLLNRTLSRAESIQRDFSGLANLVVADYDSFVAGSYDLIINATSLGLAGKVPPVPPQVVSADTCCYDMMYGDKDTAFVIWARSHGAALALDGLGMLVEQAAESFQLWRGVRPQTGPVIEALRGT